MTATLAAPVRPRGMRRLLGSPLVEALAWPHGVDRYLTQLNPLWSVHAVTGRVSRVRHLTADSVTLTVRHSGNFAGFRAGQYVRVGVEIDGVRRTRCYSIASSEVAPAGQFELTVKASPEGTVSRHLHGHARPGMVLELSQAEGEFTLPTEIDEPLLLISGGSGITPVMSMLRTLCDCAYAGPVTFLHYAFTADDIIYRSELRGLAAAHPNVRLVFAFTEQATGGDLHGFFGAEHLAAVAADPASTLTFLCGPPGLMNAVQGHYAELGLDHRLHVEQFSVTLAPVPDDTEVSGQLCFVRSNRSVDNSGASVLEQAERAGLAPQSGCRMGICHTCVRHKPSGRVRNLVSGQLSTAEPEDIQICISVPAGDVEVDL